MNYLEIIGRSSNLFEDDLKNLEKILSEIVSKNNFLVIGGAGSIGQAVTKEIFKRNPKVLHVVDISENNMVELVRDIRSSHGYIEGEFKTFAIDCAGKEFHTLMKSNEAYDYVLNLSALKHVRSEKDPYTLMRLIEVNILNTISTVDLSRNLGVQKYFCVSTDKAANPVNLMGASKRIMEMYLMRESETINISTARFANVAFSDGSLLHGFNQRFLKKQPISAPNDVMRYFLTPKESGELCLLASLLGDNRDIFFPKLSEELHQSTFSDIAERYINHLGYEPYQCSSEEEARERFKELYSLGKWPCYFFKSDTTGEKDFEEFYTINEVLDLGRFENLGVIKNNLKYDSSLLDYFLEEIKNIKNKNIWKKEDIVDLFKKTIPDFNHLETGKYLDERM